MVSDKGRICVFGRGHAKEIHQVTTDQNLCLLPTQSALTAVQTKHLGTPDRMTLHPRVPSKWGAVFCLGFLHLI